MSPVASPGTLVVSFVKAASTNTNQASHSVVVPATVLADDALLLFFANNQSPPTFAALPGWTLLRQVDANGAHGWLWGRTSHRLRPAGRFPRAPPPAPARAPDTSRPPSPTATPVCLPAPRVA